MSELKPCTPTKKSYSYFTLALKHKWYVFLSGLKIKCDRRSRDLYLSVIQDFDKTHAYISSEQYKIDVILNMDW
jgi:hypothetical protein